MRNHRSQSAMEYLMTYGWAILIIAVALAGLYSLGIFNPNTSTQRASPGQCQVLRPNGPGTNQQVSLAGLCSNQQPKYVAVFSSNANVMVGSIPSSILGASPRTVTAWVYPTQYTSEGGIVVLGSGSGCYSSFRFVMSSTGALGLDIGCGIAYTTLTAPLNTWSFVAARYSGGTYYITLNKTTQTVSLTAQNLQQGAIEIGYNFINLYPFDGYIANVQMYNNSLSSNTLESLYREGIGAAPIVLPHLLAWWPLNGNANDYSGNGYNGNAYHVSYSSSWYSGYSAPS